MAKQRLEVILDDAAGPGADPVLDVPVLAVAASRSGCPTSASSNRGAGGQPDRDRRADLGALGRSRQDSDFRVLEHARDSTASRAIEVMPVTHPRGCEHLVDFRDESTAGNRRDLVIRAPPLRSPRFRRSSPAARADSRSRRRVRNQRIVPAQRHRTRLTGFVDCLTFSLNPASRKPWPSPPKRVSTRAFVWSGRRDSNPRPSPWQGDAIHP